MHADNHAPTPSDVRRWRWGAVRGLKKSQKLSGVSVNELRALVSAGELPRVPWGDRGNLMFPRWALAELLARRESAAKAGGALPFAAEDGRGTQAIAVKALDEYVASPVVATRSEQVTVAPANEDLPSGSRSSNLPGPPPESLAAADGAMSVKQACAFTGDCRTRLFQLMTAGVLEWFYVGRHRRITRASLVRYLAALIVQDKAERVRQERSNTPTKRRSPGGQKMR